MRQIDADELKQMIAYITYQKFKAMACPGDEWTMFTGKEVEDIIDKIPTAFERPKGEWVEPADPVCYMCSVCGKYTNQEIPGRFFSYCPKCGAKLEGGVENENNSRNQ